MREYDMLFTDRELYVIAQGLQCLLHMVENGGNVTYNDDATEETVNELLNTIATKIANEKGIDLEDSDCEQDGELYKTGIDCSNCINTICYHKFCKIYNVPTSFREGPGYCKYFKKLSEV